MTEVLTADEVAELLRVGRRQVYEAVSAGKIPHQRLGRRVIFSRVAVLEWLACRSQAG